MSPILLIPKNRLMALAGILWVCAGLMVCHIAWRPFIHLLPVHPLVLLPSVTVFFVFYHRLFRPLVYKHACRVRDLSALNQPFWMFFDRKGYLMMAIMMTGGTFLRKSGLLPDWAIAFLYAGIGSALFLAGLRFLCLYSRRWVLEGEGS